jgi:hypothetical protein
MQPIPRSSESAFRWRTGFGIVLHSSALFRRRNRSVSSQKCTRIKSTHLENTFRKDICTLAEVNQPEPGTVNRGGCPAP